MAAPSQTENKKTIEAVLLSAEARRFWEQVFLATISSPKGYDRGQSSKSIADEALAIWRERFEPKAGE